MAKLLALPEQAIVSGSKGKIDFYSWLGQPVARKWPRSPGHDRSPAVQAQWPLFTQAAQLWRQLPQSIKDLYNAMASNTGRTGRDLFTQSYISGIFI